MSSRGKIADEDNWDQVIQASNNSALRRLDNADDQIAQHKKCIATSELCLGCRRMDFAGAVKAAETNDLLHITMLDRDKQLQDGCSICSLLAVHLSGSPTTNMKDTSESLTLSASTFNGYILDGQTSRLFRPLRSILLFPGQDSKDLRRYRDTSESASQGFIGLTRTQQLKKYFADSSLASGARSHLVRQHYNPAFVRHWLAQADKTEVPVCSTPDICSMRVIDCDNLTVVEVSHGMDYVALSYVWKLANEDMLPLEGIETSRPDSDDLATTLPQVIPRVISNAIRVTRDVGFRYLWVDQYCIDQEAGIEILQEHISRMDEVYASAQLTIIAASTGGALPGVEGTERSSQRLIHLPSQDDQDDCFTIFSTTPQVYGHIQSSIWYQRGWCFQECVLSTRRLYFTDYETFFQTQSLAFSETYPESHEDLEAALRGYGETMSLSQLLSQDNIQQEGEDDMYSLEDSRGQYWVRLGLFSQLLEAYSQKELSHASDSINGFRGILKSFSQSHQTFGSVAGLPLFLTDASLRASLLRADRLFMEAARSPEDLDNLPIDGSTGRRSSVSTTVTSSSRVNISAEEVVRFRHEALTALLLWRHDTHNQHEEIILERRMGFPSWSWAGWKGKVNWAADYWDFKDESEESGSDGEESDDDSDAAGRESCARSSTYYRTASVTYSTPILKVNSNWRLDSIQCKSGQILNLRHWNLCEDNSTVLGHAQHFDDAQYLIGEALVLQPQHLLLMHSRATLSKLSKLYKISSAARRVLWKIFRILRDFKPTSSLAKWPGQLALRRRLYRLCKRTRRSVLSEILQRLEVSAASFSVVELANLPLKSPVLERKVRTRLDDGSWGLLMVNSRRLLVVEWEQKVSVREQSNDARGIPQDNLRTCSRVGLLEFSHYLHTGDDAEKDMANILEKATRVRFCMK